MSNKNRNLPAPLKNRRQFLQTTSTVAATTVAAVGSISTVAASKEVNINFERSAGRAENDMGDEDEPAQHSNGMFITADNVDISTHVFEIERVDTGQEIRLEFSTKEDVDPSRLFFRIYDARGDIRNPPTATLGSSQGRTEAEGSVVGGQNDIFSSGSVFGIYRIHILQDGARIASTGKKAQGVGYTGDYEEQREDDEVTVSIPSVEEVDSSWSVNFEIENQVPIDQGGYDVNTLHESEMQLEDSQLVTTYSVDELEPIPDNAIHVRWIRFDDGETIGENLSIGGHFFGDELIQVGDEPSEMPEALVDDGVSKESYNAVVENKQELGAGNLADAINQWANTGEVNGVGVGAGELSDMINYWAGS